VNVQFSTPSKRGSGLGVLENPRREGAVRPGESGPPALRSETYGVEPR
jgi:hypothetical protein